MATVVARGIGGAWTPWWKILLALLLVGAAASGVGRLKFDNSTDAFFMKGDDTLVRYEQFRRLFASDEYSLITVETPSVIDSKFVAELRALESKIAQLKHVRRVRSIASVRAVEGRGDDLDVRGYLEGTHEDALPKKIAQAREHPYYRDLFISRDGKHLGVVVETEIIPGAVDYKIELRRQIKELIAQSVLATHAPTVVGAPILDADVRDIVQRESSLFGALVFVIIGAGFALVFRSVVAVLIPLLVAALSVVATFGLMGWAGIPITLLTPILPSFLISVGVGSSVFLLTEYFQTRHRSPESGATIAQEAVNRVRFPCVLACLTTSGALLAFSGSDIVPVMHVGLALGCALLIALVLTFTLGAALLQLMAPKVTSAQSQRLTRRASWLGRIDGFATRHQRKILGGALLVTAMASFGLTRLQTDYYYLGTFKENTPIRADYRQSDARLPRSAAIEIVLTGTTPSTFANPPMLERIAALQASIDAFQGLPVKSYSVADILKEINQALHGNRTAEYRIPSSSAAVSQGLLLFESSGNDEMSNLITTDYRTARVSVQLPTVPESQSAPLREHIERELARVWQGTDVQYSVTGLVPMWMRINGYLRSTQIQSVLLAFGITTLVLIVYTRSLSTGLLLSFVNASVVIVVLGVMAFLGWALDPYTVLIANIAIGVLDDDTMHFFTDIRRRLNEGADFDSAVSLARATSGHAMYYYALCLMVGFLVYAFSSVQSLTTFGILAALVIGLGVVWEWLVMPAYLAVLHRHGVFR